ncbi:MAG TPA: class I SAM-dependent methyltransferase [Candidatus Acidoferrum sp.]|nr:class I SAM-dependent methyltransferase [Candidatus Acidoferrum sp.]
MPTSQSEWDEKHRLAAEDPAAEPAGILRELLPLVPAGPALDLACGTGRNALFLAESGRHVTAVDWSAAALHVLASRALEKKIPVRRIERLEAVKHPQGSGIELLQADLEKITLPKESYDAIVCVRYLQRTLFPQICRALRPGGLLLYETYTEAQLEFEGGPRDPAHLLKTGELRDSFPQLHVLFYRELRAGQGIASLVARALRLRAIPGRN